MEDRIAAAADEKRTPAEAVKAKAVEAIVAEAGEPFRAETIEAKSSGLKS